MQKNIIQVPRFGKRSGILKPLKSICTGAEWSRMSNLTYLGKLDLGGQNE